MRRYHLLLLASLLSFGLSSCVKEESASNVAPTIVGVKDIQCIVNTVVDCLDGVAALDKEDGDITPNMVITISPKVEVIDGYATFTESGEYAIVYEIEDSQGRTSTKSSYVNVMSREEFASFSLPSGFFYETHGAAIMEQCGMVNGRFVIKAHDHEVAEDIKVNHIFKLKTNTEYTFQYDIDAACAGKISVLADSFPCAELQISQGYNKCSFKHIVLDNEEDTRNVEISLCFGSIDGDIDLAITNLETQFPQQEGAIVDLSDGFSFLGRVIRRIENGIEGNCWSDIEGNEAILEITKSGNNIWEGGMFIQTGIELQDGVTYTISFDIEADVDHPYEVIIQRGQWDEYKFNTIVSPSGHVEKTIHVDGASKGALWLFVQSGNQNNRIVMSHLKVEEHLGPVGKNSYVIEDYHESHSSGYNCAFSSTLGDFHYQIDRFGYNDYDQKVASPTFHIVGSSGNYVLSFAAKATAPIEVVVAAPVAGGWDPTILWTRVNLSEKLTNYTFFFNGNGTDRDYTIVWQFGSGNNQKYEHVEIDISQVSISLRNIELDGEYERQ